MKGLILDKKGLTLIEVMLAIMLLGTALVCVLMLFSNSTALITQSNDLVTATTILQQQIETIRTMPFATIVTTYSSPTSFNSSSFADLSNPVGTITVDYPLGTTSPYNELLRVTANLTWTGVGGRNYSKSMVTLISEGGIDKK